MKFTLLSNDKVKFKIKQRWDFTLSETIVDNSYCYDYIKYFASSIKNYNPTRSVTCNNILNLEIYKNKETINYDISDFELYFNGKGNYIKVNSIEVEVDELTNKAKIQINIERVSLAKKALSFLAHKISFPKRRIKND